jgi:hypothetical protein
MADRKVFCGLSFLTARDAGVYLALPLHRRRFSMQELCPFCAQPIAREYGTFRCKSCAKSSEDMIDLERKARAAEIRKAQRATRSSRSADPAPVAGAPEAKRRALALAIARHAARKKDGTALVGAGAGKKASKRSA